MNRSLHRAALLLIASSTLAAQTSTAPKPSLFTASDAIWSAVFLGGSVALSTADVRITRWMLARHNDSRDAVARNISRAQEGTLTVGNLALFGVARLAKWPNVADITFHAAEAVVVGSVASQVIRGPLGRARPYESKYTDQYDFHWFQGFTNFKYRAFPSIHTASAFGVATVYTLEAQRRSHKAAWIVGPIAYGLAAAPGISRLYQGQHWASDILSGAFMGTLAGAKIVRYNHVVNRHNRVNRFFLGDANIQTGFSATGASFSFTF
ncbi:MAG TPA: phosphatase PAP2 family protein [Gemmatimonadaceae bacterium]|nr:phosphatase PAP2 family protein [Gemmatimonadaceae bacterium]